jgi:hypothetical protein
MAFARLALLLVVAQLLGAARASAPGGSWLPDPLVALAAALAVAGRREKVLTAALVLALLRAPTTLGNPVMGIAALVGFAALVLGIRHVLARERPAIPFAVGFLAMSSLALLDSVAAGARSEPAAGLLAALPASLTTAALTPALVPLLRAFPGTRRLLERRFGE